MIRRLERKGILHIAEHSKKAIGKNGQTPKGLKPLVSMLEACRRLALQTVDTQTVDTQTVDTDRGHLADRGQFIKSVHGQVSDNVEDNMKKTVDTEQETHLLIAVNKKEEKTVLRDTISHCMVDNESVHGFVHGHPFDLYQAVRQVLDSVEHGIEHRRAMAELASTHWAPRILKSGDIIGPDQIGLDGHIYPEFLPQCQCGHAVTYLHQEVAENRFKIFPKQICASCIELQRLQAREADEKEYARLLKKGWVKFIHDGDKVSFDDCVLVNGEMRLRYFREVALDRCECGQLVHYELLKSDSGLHVNAGEQCPICVEVSKLGAGTVVGV